MIEILKALAVTLVCSYGAFWLAARAFAGVIPAGTIARWRNLYLAATIVCFLIPNYWLMLLVLVGLIFTLGAAEKFKPALYLLLLFALPAAEATVPGFAGINNFLRLYPFNVLAIVLLFPLVIAGRGVKLASLDFRMTDVLFGAFFFLSILLAFRDTTFTDGVRISTTVILTSFSQYLVFSRVHWTMERVKLATAAIVIPLMALSAIGVAEVILHWHFYVPAIRHWNIDFFFRYLERSGWLRAYATILGPIAFGMFVMIGLSLIPPLIRSAKTMLFPRLSFLVLGGGLLSSLSRGPWVGAAFAFAVHAATTEKPVSSTMKLGIGGVALLAILAITPVGNSIIELIPFFGGAATNTIDYRKELFDTGVEVVRQNPWFGSKDYIDLPAMQRLVQGQGIIDVVNTYLRVALDTGLVGLSLFVGANLFAVLGLYRSLKGARRKSSEFASYCQGYLAALLSMLLVIATTSSYVAQVQEVNWMLCGMCVGLARAVALVRATERNLAPAAPSEATQTVPTPVETAGAKPLPPHLRQYLRGSKPV